MCRNSSIMMTCFIFLATITVIFAGDRQEGCCSYGEPCWPSNSDLVELFFKLGGYDFKRTLFHTPGKPIPAPLTKGRTEQPLYGEGIDMQPIYVQNPDDRGWACNDFSDTYCKISARFSPRGADTPAFVVWPATAEHVQEAVRFSVKHNLCVSVAGTGHDYQNRHSNDGSLFIRTSLLKSMEYDLSVENEFGHANVKLGAGLTFHEIQHAASKHGKMVVSGWCSTVGILGWSTGGGRGYGTSLYGLGADNILEAEIVTADGNSIKVNANQNQDLYWAIRGGGGAPWGVFTSITVRLHDYPTTGVNKVQYTWEDTFCNYDTFETLIEKYFQLSLTFSAKWGGLANVGMYSSSDSECSSSNWSFKATYYYFGATSDTEFQDIKEKFDTLAPNPWKFMKQYNNIYEQFDSEMNHPYISTHASGSNYNVVTGVLASRKSVEDGTTAEAMKEVFEKCKSTGGCHWQWQNDLTGMVGSPQETNTALNDGMRSALFNLISSGGKDFSDELGRIGNYSYYAQSEYTMTNWREQYWGMNDYERLLSIKRQYDPNNIFWCHHCVGSEDGRLSQSHHAKRKSSLRGL